MRLAELPVVLVGAELRVDACSEAMQAHVSMPLLVLCGGYFLASNGKYIETNLKSLSVLVRSMCHFPRSNFTNLVSFPPKTLPPPRHKPISDVPTNFVWGRGDSTNSVEDRENGDLGAVVP